MTYFILVAGAVLYVKKNHVILTVCKSTFLFDLSVGRETC